MRILQLLDTLRFGGAEQIVATLAVGLRARGHDVHIACLRDFGAESVDHQRLLHHGVQLTALEKPPGVHPPTLAKLTRLLQRERIDIINTHNHLVHHYGVAAGRWTGAKVVNTLHGIDTLNVQVWAGLLYCVCCQFSDRIVSVCPPVRQALLRRYSMLEDKVLVIQNGIALEPFLALPLRSPHSGTVFGTVGRMVPVKDHRNLLQAFAFIHQRHPESRLKLLGTGPLAQELMAAARELKIAGVVEFCGFSSTPATFLNEVDVFVLPSKSEGMPLTLLEAMAAGRPVIATAVGGIPGIVDPQYGWLCPPGDSGRLAQCMEASLTADQPLMGSLARARAKEAYGQQTMVLAYESLYQSLLPAPPSSNGSRRAG